MLNIKLLPDHVGLPHVPHVLVVAVHLAWAGWVEGIVKQLGLGTWDLGPGTWDLGPGNRK